MVTAGLWSLTVCRYGTGISLSMGWFDNLTGGRSEDKPPYFTIPEPLHEYLNLLQVEVPPQIHETYNSFTSTQLAYAGVACGVSFLMGVRVGRIRPVWRA